MQVDHTGTFLWSHFCELSVDSSALPPSVGPPNAVDLAVIASSYSRHARQCLLHPSVNSPALKQHLDCPLEH